MKKILVIWLASLLASVCLGDKNPISPVLRVPQSSSPVFSTSIESIPVGSNSNQQSVFSKNPVHASASASVGGGSSINDQILVAPSAEGGRQNNPWYTPNFDFNSGVGDSYTTSNQYADPPPQPTQTQHTSATYPAPQVTQNYGTPQNQYGTPQNQYGAPQNQYGTPEVGPSYTYHYKHYPTSSSSNHHGWSGDNDGGADFGDFGGGGIGALKGIGIVGLIAKGILAVKPFLILGLLFLIAIPILFLLLPIPIVTITGQQGRGGRSSQVASYLSNLSVKVLNAEECLERVICKMPQAPEKYQSKAKLLWDEYGQKLVKNGRVSRGLGAYFETSSLKNRHLKCEQRFKCTNKYL